MVKNLNKILKNHEHYLHKDCEGWENMRANLEGVNLSNRNLRDVNLKGANLYNADLTNTNLSGADLSDAILVHACARYTNLSYTNLTNANLYKANLTFANLRHTKLNGANLNSSCLQFATLVDVNFTNASLYDTNLSYTNLTPSCNINEVKMITHPEYRFGKILTEPIIGYKKAVNNKIITLEIPAGAIVFSISGNQCRTNKAKVLSIESLDPNDKESRAFSKYNHMSYYVGDVFNIRNFNCIYNVEYAEGIHFFMTKEEAYRYNLC